MSDSVSNTTHIDQCNNTDEVDNAACPTEEKLCRKKRHAFDLPFRRNIGVDGEEEEEFE